MKREEQIRNAATEYATHLVETDITDFHGKYEKKMDFVLPEYNAFLAGAKWADKNHNPQNIAEYLYKEKGYPISLNGDIPTFEETMKTVQAYNAYKEKQWIEKACNWLIEQKEMIDISFQEDFIERFKIAMEE